MRERVTEHQRRKPITKRDALWHSVEEKRSSAQYKRKRSQLAAKIEDYLVYQ